MPEVTKTARESGVLSPFKSTGRTRMALPIIKVVIKAAPFGCTGLSSVTSENPLGVPSVWHPPDFPFCRTLGGLAANVVVTESNTSQLSLFIFPSPFAPCPPLTEQLHGL